MATDLKKLAAALDAGDVQAAAAVLFPPKPAAPKIITDYWPKPIPMRQFDWTAITDDYDGADDAGPQLVGYGRTEAEAIADLKAQCDDCPDCGALVSGDGISIDERACRRCCGD